MQNKFSLILSTLSALQFSSATLIHHDDRATSYQHIEIEHFRPVRKYIKHEDKERFLKHPVSLGNTLTKLQVDHNDVHHFKQPVYLGKTSIKELEHNQKSNNNVQYLEHSQKNNLLKHPVYPSFQGNKEHILGLGAYSSDEIHDYHQYGVHENEDEVENDKKQQNYIHRHQKNEEDYKLNFVHASDEQQKEDGIMEGTPEFEMYQKLAQAALLEYEQQIDPSYQLQRDR